MLTLFLCVHRLGTMATTASNQPASWTSPRSSLASVSWTMACPSCISHPLTRASPRPASRPPWPPCSWLYSPCEHVICDLIFLARCCCLCSIPFLLSLVLFVLLLSCFRCCLHFAIQTLFNEGCPCARLFISGIVPKPSPFLMGF